MVVRPQSLAAGQIRPGRLLQTHLARVLFTAQRTRRTGVLRVDEGVIETRLHIRRGTIVYASRGPLGETLGRVLMRAGILDRSEYMLILERMAEPSEADEVMRFGDVAIRLGMLGAAELHEALALQVRHKLMHCFRIDEAVWSWADDEAPREGPPFETPLEAALRDALRDDPAGQRWTGLLRPLLDHLVHLTDTPEALVARFGGSPAELRVLRRAEHRPLRVLLGGSTPPEETAALFVALHLADAATFEAPPARTEPDPQAIAEARRERVVARLEAERTVAASTPDAIEDRAREAAQRLREEMQRRGRATSTTPRGRIDAERSASRGLELLSRGKPEGALGHFERAVALLPEAAEYLLYQHWTRYLVSRDAAEKTAILQVVRATLVEALRQDRRFAFAHYVHGRLCLERDEEKKAERAFDIASRLDPGLLDARRYQRLLESRRGR